VPLLVEENVSGQQRRQQKEASVQTHYWYKQLMWLL